MIQTNVNDEYLRALHMAQKEKKKLEAMGKSPYPAVLEEDYPGYAHAGAYDLPVRDIPADRIIGTVTKSRTNAFSASFLPLHDPKSEFAAKWIALCSAHLSEVGIRDPVECCEYLGNFYVLEGNKRVSVLRYFGAVRIPAKVRRVLPADKSDPRAAAYGEFLEFFKSTGLYDIQFNKPGDYARLCASLGRKPGEKWEEDEVRGLSSCFCHFKEAFTELGGIEKGLCPEDALLMFLRVYTYGQLEKMDTAEIKKALAALWGDVQASSDPGSITLKTAPEDDDKKSVIGKLITGAPRHLNVALIYRLDPEHSPWASGHAEGASFLSKTLGDQVSVTNYFHADSHAEAEELLDRAAKEGADVIFTTAPPLLNATLKAAVRHPKIRFFNCSASKPLSSVRTYYCRTYEGKFITGLIAGALADNDKVGYVGSYPILGVPASINAFALGVRMTNPRAEILLEWSCLAGDPVAALREKGARVISNRDVPLPGLSRMESGNYGTFVLNENGGAIPLASPCWMWGKMYERIIRSILGGSIEKKDQAEAVNYWWGMDSGVIDVTLSDAVPAGVRNLASAFIERMRAGEYDPFSQTVRAYGGDLICGGEKQLSSMEILRMDRLSDAVTGRIPEYGELLPMSKELVRELLLPNRDVEIPAAEEEEI